jgi:predicted SAM-dependent methyltransferase
MNHVIDLGCGPNKVPGAYGVDHFPYEGVDQVFCLDETPWPLDDGRYSKIYARHVIEHVADVRQFMNEIHRIGEPGAIVEIVTPHFSSHNSWEDPTHRWHLSTGWYKPFTESYLAEQVSAFEHVSTELAFSKSWRSKLGKLLVRLKGLAWWEKHYAFIYRARDLTTRLKIIK